MTLKMKRALELRLEFRVNPKSKLTSWTFVRCKVQDDLEWSFAIDYEKSIVLFASFAEVAIL